MIKNNNICRSCSHSTIEIFTGTLISHQVRYFECTNCGYVQTETPHWLDHAYAVAINDSDTGIMARNQINARIALATMLLLGKLDGNLVDCAGGYGILVRLLRDFGINALWSDRHCQNLLAKGFEHTNEKADLVTAFEVFEHFVNPAEELDGLLTIAPNVLLSTKIIADPAPKQDDWWYYGKNHGQHIGFFRMQSLAKLAQDRGKFLVSDGKNYHLITTKPINTTVWKIILNFNKVFTFLHCKSLTMKDHDFIMQSTKSDEINCE
jgi:hypothetical protein